MQTLRVTAAIIRKGHQVLIAQRRPDDPLAFLWEFPGGKIKAGETPQECLAREIKEELSLDIKVGEFFLEVSHVYLEQNLHIILLAYLCDYVAGAPVALECHDFRWVSIHELKEFSFAPADKPIVHHLQKW